MSESLLLRDFQAPRHLSAGFTLLEVMVALTILGMSLLWLLKGQADSLARNVGARMRLQAVYLANYKILETEQLLRQEGFGTFEGENCGDFESEHLEGVENFRYCVSIEKIALPDLSMFTQQLAGALGASDAAGGQEQEMPGELPPFFQSVLSQLMPGSGVGSDLLSGLSGMMGNILTMAISTIQNVLEQAVRRVRVTVFWNLGKREKSYELIAFFTDPAVLDQNILDLSGLAGSLTGGSGTGSSGSGTGGRIP